MKNIEVTTNEKTKGCDTLFWDVRPPEGKRWGSVFGKCVLRARRAVIGHHRPLTKEDAIRVAEELTLHDIPCRVTGWWGFYM